jgi:hypothetical protein
MNENERIERLKKTLGDRIDIMIGEYEDYDWVNNYLDESTVFIGENPGVVPLPVLEHLVTITESCKARLSNWSAFQSAVQALRG